MKPKIDAVPMFSRDELALLAVLCNSPARPHEVARNRDIRTLQVKVDRLLLAADMEPSK